VCWLKLTSPSLFRALAFNSGWEYRNADYCVNIDDDFSTYVKPFVNFSPVTPEIIFWLFCMGGDKT